MALLLMIPNDSPRRVDASAAAATHRQLHLDLTEAARALVDRAADLAIRDSVTDANVHGLNVNVNENDCQF